MYLLKNQQKQYFSDKTEENINISTKKLRKTMVVRASDYKKILS